MLYKNYRGTPISHPNTNVSAKTRLKGGEKSDELSHKTLLKGEDMRAAVGQDVFVFQVPERAFPARLENSPTSRAFMHTRAHACRPLFLEPSARHSIPRDGSHLPRHPLARQIFISRAPAARHCGIRVGYSCSD